MGYSITTFGDTSLNKSSILKREGIRTVNIKQDSKEDTKSFTEIAISLNENGMIKAARYCTKSTKERKGFCLTDTCLYDHSGRLQEFRSMDPKGNIAITSLLDYSNKGIVKYEMITRTIKKIDTSIWQHYYNDEGRIIGSEFLTKGFASYNGSVFYNQDGFPDSIQNEGSNVPTTVFKRREGVRYKEIEMETRYERYRWAFTDAGQCITFAWALKFKPKKTLPNIPARPKKGKIDYYYNPNGTLLKVVVKTEGRKREKYLYSYSK